MLLGNKATVFSNGVARFLLDLWWEGSARRNSVMLSLDQSRPQTRAAAEKPESAARFVPGLGRSQ